AFQATDHHVGIQVVVHDQRHAILPAFPILQGRAFMMSTEAVGREVVCEPPSAVCGLGERPATRTTVGDHPVGSALRDHVQDRAYGPLAHDCAASRAFTPL